jgi:LPXTG-site transpeptidase (sortase) family protein
VPYADANYHGPAIFRELYLLAPGDRIFVDRNGETLEYQVAWSEQVGANDGARWTEIWSADVATDSITLYTCGGDFDWDTREYPDRLVVRAERV